MNFQAMAMEFVINLIPIITLAYLVVGIRFLISESRERFQFFPS